MRIRGVVCVHASVCLCANVNINVCVYVSHGQVASLFMHCGNESLLVAYARMLLLSKACTKYAYAHAQDAYLQSTIAVPTTQYERARVIYKYALDNIPKQHAKVGSIL